MVSKLDVSRSIPAIRYSICILSDMTWKVFVYDVELVSSQLTANIPTLLSTTMALRNLVIFLDSGCICDGNRDGKFEELLTYRGFSGSSSEYTECTHVALIHKTLVLQDTQQPMWTPVY